MLVVVLVLENPDRFAIRLTEQISLQDIGLFAVTESMRRGRARRRGRGRFQISEFGLKIQQHSSFVLSASTRSGLLVTSSLCLEEDRGP